MDQQQAKVAALAERVVALDAASMAQFEVAVAVARNIKVNGGPAEQAEPAAPVKPVAVTGDGIPAVKRGRGRPRKNTTLS